MTSATVQDYLKHIFLLEQEAGTGALVSMGQLAATMNVAPGTATAMVKRLADSDLISYEPYGGVRLTDKGRRDAMGILRRHRLIETFLVEVLGLDWSEVHEDAEDLEHAISDRLLERIDAFLDYPAVDPHGDPIPTHEGTIETVEERTAADCRVGERVRIVRIRDQRRAFLRFVEASRLRPPTTIEVESIDEMADSMTLRPVDGRAVTLGRMAAAKLVVMPE